MTASNAARPPVAFLGTGIMGSGMAANLVRAGFPVTVWNRTRSKTGPLADLGASVASSIAEAVAGAHVVCCCVTSSVDVEAIVLGPGGVAESARPDAVFVDHSTIAPETSQELAGVLALQGIHALDAPVTGGEAGARDRTLTIMVGGEASIYRRVLPVLEAMGKEIFHVGPAGRGQLLKLIGNLIGGVTMAGTLEGLALGLRGGLDLETMLPVLRHSSANSAFLQVSGERLLQGNYEPGFSLRNRTKDFDLALEAARRQQAPLPVTALTRELFAALVPEYGDRDQLVYVKAIERLLGQPLFPE